jgi:hypothetical protein
VLLQHSEQSERLHGKVRWAEVAAQLPGRTDADVKHVYERLKKHPVGGRGWGRWGPAGWLAGWLARAVGWPAVAAATAAARGRAL